MTEPGEPEMSTTEPVTPTEHTAEPDGWDVYAQRYAWPEHEVSAPGRIDVCPLCGSLVGEWSGQRVHTAWHRSRGEAPTV